MARTELWNIPKFRGKTVKEKPAKEQPANKAETNSEKCGVLVSERITYEKEGTVSKSNVAEMKREMVI